MHAAITNMFCHCQQAGHYDGYVPAAGPSRAPLADTTNALPKKKTGMENSMWAPKNRPALANTTNALPPKKKTGLENSMWAPKRANIGGY